MIFTPGGTLPATGSIRKTPVSGKLRGYTRHINRIGARSLQAPGRKLNRNQIWGLSRRLPKLTIKGCPSRLEPSTRIKKASHRSGYIHRAPEQEQHDTIPCETLPTPSGGIATIHDPTPSFCKIPAARIAAPDQSHSKRLV